MPAPGEVTRLLLDWGGGDKAALDRLIPYVHGELRRLARSHMRRERPGHTLQTTALINEAYLRLVGQDVPWQSRAHFFGIASRLVRQILVDHARAELPEARRRPATGLARGGGRRRTGARWPTSTSAP